jgi:pimeloyl-ACP methyl ester carboxylesterase
VSGADDDYVELFRETHILYFSRIGFTALLSRIGFTALFSRIGFTTLAPANNNRSMRANCLLYAALLCASMQPAIHAQELPTAIATDPPANKAFPAAMETFQIPSHGAMLNALAYIAEGAGPHPVVVLLHGFPGNEKNLDLAQSIRRDGWDVVYFDYRGSWGSPGDFSFTHSIEDTQAAVAYLRDAEHAKKLRADPGYIVLIGHSMGGFMARYVGAQDAGIKAVGLISAADMGVDRVQSLNPEQQQMAVKRLAAHFADEGMAPLAGCTPESLAKEIVANAAAWNVPNLAAKFTSRPVLVVTSDDGLAASNDAFVAALRKAGGTDITTVHLTTDHSYSDQRIALEKAVLEALEFMRRNQQPGPGQH